MGIGGGHVPRFHAAMAGLAAAFWSAVTIGAASPAVAGASLYDMSGLLAEPHPFAVAPPAPPAPGAPRRGGAGRVYDMAPALGEPHPFDVAAPQPAAPRGEAPRAAPPEPALPPAVSAIKPASGAAEPTYLELALGWYDFNDNEDAAEFRVEWRGRAFWWKLKPLAGVMATSNAAVYGFGGLAADFRLGRRLVLTPSFAAGLYSDGGGKDPGSAIEFRSAIQLSWQFDGGGRLGATVYHISNAGISDNNPGTEVLSIGYAIPLN